MLPETDRQFIETHNFTAGGEEESLWHKWLNGKRKEDKLLVDGFVEGHPGERFSAAIVAKETGLGEDLCAALLAENPFVTKQRGWHKRNQYLSIAEPLTDIPEETPQPSQKDILGEQAREDWKYLHDQRRLAMKRKYRVMKHF